MARLAVDFDGVLHRYSAGWLDGMIYDPPTEGAQAALAKLQEQGHTIIISSCRADSPTGKADIFNWLKANGFQNVEDIEITDRKPPATAYIDDRAVRFTNWADMVKLWT